MQTDLLLVALSALVVALAAMMFPVWLRHRARHLTARLGDLEVMRETARALLNDDNLPDVMADLVVDLVAAAHTPRLSRAFFKAVVTGEIARPTAPAGRRAVVAAAVEQMTSAQLLRFARLYEHVLLSSASSDPLFAYAGRRILTWGLRSVATNDKVEPEKARSEAPVVASHLRERYKAAPHSTRTLAMEGVAA